MNEALSILFSEEAFRRERFIAALWQNWSMILGEYLGGLAFPLGHKDETLIIGAEDNMAMQELSLQSPEILERVNAFMDEEVFSKVKLELLLGQRPLQSGRPARPVMRPAPAIPPRPPRLGTLRGVLDASSLVGKCYEAYVALYDGERR